MPDIDEVTATRVELEGSGYREIAEFKKLRPGARVRHSGHQWAEAYWKGSATVVAVMEKDPSSWSRTYRQRDVEVIVALDKESFGKTVTYWANYHTDVVEVADASH